MNRTAPYTPIRPVFEHMSLGTTNLTRAIGF